MSADDRNCTSRFGVDAFCLVLHGSDLHIRSGAWSTKHGNCSAWAKTIPMPEDKESFRRNAYLVVDQVNPGLVDLFIRQARKTVQEKEKGSVLQKLKQELPAHKPAASKKREPER